MQKAAALYIFEWIQLSRRVGIMKQNKTVMSWAERSCLVHQEVFLSKQHLWSHWHAMALLCTQAAFLSKQVHTDNHGRLKFPTLCTSILLGKQISAASSSNNECWGKEASNVAGAFLRKFVSITMIDGSNLAKKNSFPRIFVNLI